VAPQFAFQIGELLRRLGEKKDAPGWYQKCIETTDADSLKKLALVQKTLTEK
jgi:hypothetical protein